MPHHLTHYPAFEVSAPRPVSDDFLRRLCAFLKGQPDDAAFISPIWESGRHYTKELEAALRSGKLLPLRALLDRLYDGMAMFGFDWGLNMYAPPHLIKAQREWEKHAFALAHATGLIAPFNPEQPREEHWAPEKLIERLETRLGRLDHPGGGAMPGARVGDRFIPMKLLRENLVRVALDRIPDHAILEIGAGSGMLAYLLQPRIYHTIDLPIVTVIQAYLLAGAGYEDVLWLHGEKSVAPPLISLHGLNTDWPDLVDVVVNQDSLPEIPEALARTYLELAWQKVEPGGHFYSVNHESQNGAQTSVAGLMQDFPGFRLVQRSPFWGREGYLEEVWQHA